MDLILAADSRWGIGKNGGLLCHLSGDLKYFKRQTMSKTVIMGRVTLQSLPGGKGLPGRRNIVLTRDKNFAAENAEIVHSTEELLSLLDDAKGGEPFASDATPENTAESLDVNTATFVQPGESPSVHTADAGLSGDVSSLRDAMVIGGAAVYEELFPFCQTCYITKIEGDFGADRFFLNMDERPDFTRETLSPVQEENGIRYQFFAYHRVGK